MWEINLRLDYAKPILPLYAICQATALIKRAIGAYMLKQGKWIQNLTT
ncbi:MAG: hypothetical protein ACI3V4_10875 [Faecousia sp.]